MAGRLSEEAELALAVIHEFRQASLKQIGLILGDEEKAKRVVKHLFYYHYVNLLDDGQYVTARHVHEIDNKMIDALWIVLDSLTVEGVIDIDSLLSVSTEDVTGKVLASFIRNEKYIINVCHVNQNNLVDVAYLQQRFYAVTNAKIGMEKEEGIVYYFIAADDKTEMDIDKMNLKIPYILIRMKKNGTDVPNISYKVK